MTRRVLLTLIAVAGCVPVARPATPEAVVRSASEFEAVLGWLIENEDGELFVDPKPYGIVLGPSVPGRGGYLEGDSARHALEVRRAALVAFGVDSTTAFPLRRGCMGYFLPPGVKDTSGCPQSTEIETVLDLVGSADSLGMKSMKRVRVSYGHNGSIMEIRELVLAPQGGGWAVVREDVLASYGEGP